MSGNVHFLNGKKPTQLGEPRQELIGVLENLLERAKSGELQSFLGVGFTAAGLRACAWIDLHEDVYAMLGSIEWLKAEYIHRHTDEDQHP